MVCPLSCVVVEFHDLPGGGEGNYGVAATKQVTQYFRGGEKKARAAGWNG